MKEEPANTQSGSAARPSVSIVVPSYNHARFVEKCLQSIMKQTFPISELNVIDDGSMDNSPAIIERALKTCPFPCELIVRSNRGLSATLNEGLHLSKGNYFAYLGSISRSSHRDSDKAKQRRVGLRPCVQY
jgi:alpha-1,3-rhamnosyltransferase